MLIDRSKVLVALAVTLAAVSTACVIVTGDGDRDGTGGSGAGAESAGGSTENASGGSGAGGSGAGGSGGGPCLDDVGAPAECFSECEGYTNCGGTQYFKNGVAAQLVSCLNKLDPATCSSVDDAINSCGLGAMNNACVDGTSSFTCTQIATDCVVVDDQAWQSECGAYVDSLSDLGRAVFAQCAVDACGEGAAVDLQACVLALFP